MRVAMIADELFASREGALMARLAVGLVDEGVRVVHVVPESALAKPEGLGLGGVAAPTVALPPGGLLTRESSRAERLAQRIAQAWGRDRESGLDVVHVMGGSVWGLGLALAERGRSACAIEVWRGGQVPRAAALSRERRSRQAGPAPVFFAPDKHLEHALLAAEPSLVVRATPWGVHTPSAMRKPLRGDRSPAVMIVGTGREPGTYNAAFAGLAAACARFPDMMIFADSLAVRNAQTWALARRMNVLDRLSLIEELEARRDVLLQGDVLVVPDAKGEHRTIALDAMACGMVVVALADPLASTLIDGRTARLVRTPDPEAWRAAVTELLENPASSASLALSARTFVRQERKASGHVRAVLDAYTWMAGTYAMASPAPARPPAQA